MQWLLRGCVRIERGRVETVKEAVEAVNVALASPTDETVGAITRCSTTEVVITAGGRHRRYGSELF